MRSRAVSTGITLRFITCFLNDRSVVLNRGARALMRLKHGNFGKLIYQQIHLFYSLFKVRGLETKDNT